MRYNTSLFGTKRLRLFILSHLLGIDMFYRVVTLLLFLLLSFHAWAETDDEALFVKIGVLSHRGNDKTLQMWTPTADYLIGKLPKYDFEIVPLDFDKVEAAVKTASVDFILVNSGIYVNLEAKYGVSRLATMINLRNNTPYHIFGGVIFTRSDQNDITTLEDIRGKSFTAVDKTSLGGFQMAWRELNAKHIDPFTDLALNFSGTHDQTVLSVLNKEFEVGTVRTDILERMHNEGVIDIKDIKVLNPQKQPQFPYAHSTRLYPEWPFSKLKQTNPELAKQVAVALLQIPKEDPALVTGKYAGWAIPLDYNEVHGLFKELKLPPYLSLEKLTMIEVLKRHWYWVSASLIMLLTLISIMSTVIRHNRSLKRIQRRMERQHELINQSVADGIYGVDMNGNCTFMNKAMEEMTGWNQDDLIGKNQHTILHHTHEDGSPHPREECPAYRSSFDNQARFIVDDIFWKKDGSYINVEYSCTPLRGITGKTRGSVVVFRDITERKHAQKVSQEHQQQLSHVGRLSLLGEMASGLAHELNQPLTAISTNSRACIRLLEADEKNAEGCADVMERIAAQAERAGSVIQHIRHFAHKELPDKKPVKINDMMETVLDLLHPEIKTKQIILTLDIDQRAPMVLAQDIQIEQVILNLVRNAIESLENVPKAKRNLTICTTKKTQHRIEIRVTDTGRGLQKIIKDQLFEPFMTTKSQGMGLGLSISQGIIEAHGDEIKVETPTGHSGVSFYFHLPQASAKEIKEALHV